MPKPIVFCADDFGMNRAVNAGILKLASAGSLSATSCMTKGRAFAQDAPALSGLPIQKGLHLNLTEGMGDASFWQPLPRLIRNCYFRRIDAVRLQTEIEEQLLAFEEAFGMPPDYVDGHQHVHQLPVVRDCLLETLKKKYGSHRPWLRSTVTPPRLRPLLLWLKASVIEALGAQQFLHLAKRGGFPRSRFLLGVYDFSGGEQRYVELLDAWIAQASPADVVMCHPACGLDGNDALSQQRQAEYAVLADSRLAKLLAKHDACVARGDFTFALGSN